MEGTQLGGREVEGLEARGEMGMEEQGILGVCVGGGGGGVEEEGGGQVEGGGHAEGPAVWDYQCTDYQPPKGNESWNMASLVTGGLPQHMPLGNHPSESKA